MKSSNEQILEELRLYRQKILTITPQYDETIRKILKSCSDDLVDMEIKKRKDHVDAMELLVKQYEQLFHKKEDLSRQINSKENSVATIKLNTQNDAYAKATVAATVIENKKRNITDLLVENFENQITAMRIRDTKVSIGHKQLQGKTLDDLLEEENNLQQELNDINSQPVPNYKEIETDTEEIRALDAEILELKKQRDEILPEIKQMESSLKQYGFSTTLSRAHKDLNELKRNYTPRSAVLHVNQQNLLEHLSTDDRNAVIDYLNTMTTVTVNANYSGFRIEQYQFPHLLRVLCTSFIHPLSPFSLVGSNRIISSNYANYLAAGLGPSVVADKWLEHIIIDNCDITKPSIYTTYQNIPNNFCVVWGKKENKVLPQYPHEREEEGREPFVIVNTQVLDMLEQIITQNPTISFPDLAIRLSNTFPDPQTQGSRMTALKELKRLYEETPEQVLITEQRYYKEQELKQLAENARLEREEIARQAELDREHAEYLAEQGRRAMERQADYDRMQVIISAAQAERQQAEYERAAKSRAREEEIAQNRAQHMAWKQCRNCAKFFGCRNPGIHGCGAFVPKGR